MVDDEQQCEDDGGRIRPAILDRLSEDQIRVLADPRARAALRHLSGRSTATVSRLADAVTGSEAAATGSIAGPDRRESNLIALHHETLPKLDDCGFVRYDSSEHEVTETDVPPAVSELLERTD